jgi:hypothetical protein
VENRTKSTRFSDLLQIFSEKTFRHQQSKGLNLERMFERTLRLQKGSPHHEQASFAVAFLVSLLPFALISLPSFFIIVKNA